MSYSPGAARRTGVTCDGQARTASRFHHHRAHWFGDVGKRLSAPAILDSHLALCVAGGVIVISRSLAVAGRVSFWQPAATTGQVGHDVGCRGIQTEQLALDAVLVIDEHDELDAVWSCPSGVEQGRRGDLHRGGGELMDRSANLVQVGGHPQRHRPL